MAMTIPAQARLLLDFIGEIEAPKGYDVIYANRQNKLPKSITQMTIAELQFHQANGWPAKSTASGRYQFMRATLKDLRAELDLNDDQIFNADLQDRLAYHLLKKRGYEAFMAGKLSIVGFGKNLAKEWASLPVLADTRGAHRVVERGQSYYAGDGVNKSLVKPDRVETLLAAIKELPSMPTLADPSLPRADDPPAQEHWFTMLVRLAIEFFASSFRKK